MIGFKGEICDFFTNKGYKLEKETGLTMVFVNGDRKITIKLSYSK